MALSVLDHQLFSAYADILNGYSLAIFKGKTIYIRHFSTFEQAEIDRKYLNFLQEAKEKGLATEEERTAELVKMGLWSDEKAKKIIHQQSFVEGLRKNKTHALLPSQMADINKQLIEEEDKLAGLLFDKDQTFGLYAEKFVNKQLNELYIFYSLKADPNLKEPLFTQDDYETLEIEEINTLFDLYQKETARFNNKNIKLIALKPFFQNPFALCEGRIFDFFGKPISQLTFFQTELASYGRYFKHVLNDSPPEHLLNDPDALLDWTTGEKNRSKVLNNNHDATALVGATKEDLEAIKKDNQEVISLGDLAKQKGGRLSMHDLMASHGVNLG